MDIFNYTLKIQELERAKYKKQYDAIMRECHKGLQEMKDHSGRGNTVHVYLKESNFEETKLWYKIYAKAINGISDLNTTAGFLTDDFDNFEKAMVRYVAELGDYNEYLDTFQYSKDIMCDSGLLTKLFTKYNEMIGNNPYPYKLRFLAYASHNYSNIGYEVRQQPYFSTKYVTNGTNIQLLIELEDYKTTLDPTIKYTLLEESLDEIYNSPLDSGNINSITDIRESAQRIVDAIDTIKARTDGQLPIQAPAA